MNKSVPEFHIDIPQLNKLSEYIEEEIIQFENRLTQLESLLSHKVNEDKFKSAYELCYAIVDSIPFMTTFVCPKWILRVRPNGRDEIFKEECEVSYNRDIAKIKAGRFNRPYESVFYGALPIPEGEVAWELSAILECDKELTDDSILVRTRDYTCSFWLVNDGFYAINLCHEETHMKANSSLKEGIDNFISILRQHVSPKAFEYILKIWKFYSGLSSQRYVDNTSYYILTALFCAIKDYYMAKKNTVIDGLIYPGCMTEARGLNIVMMPDAVDRLLTLDKVYMHRMFLDKFDNKTYYGFPCSKISTVVDGKFTIPSYNPPGDR